MHKKSSVMVYHSQSCEGFQSELLGVLPISLCAIVHEFTGKTRTAWVYDRAVDSTVHGRFFQKMVKLPTVKGDLIVMDQVFAKIDVDPYWITPINWAKRLSWKKRKTHSSAYSSIFIQN